MAAGGKTAKIANFLNSEWIVMYDRTKKWYSWIFIIKVIVNLNLAPEDGDGQGSNQYERLYP